MLIKCWGSRGSIPVSGNEYNKYGGDTACIEIRSKNDEVIIIDAGSGIRNLGNSLLKESKNNYSLIFTHAHWDHLLGFPFFKPIYLKGMKIDVFGCPFSQESIKKIFSDSMIPPFFPVEYDDLKATINFHGACTGRFKIDTIEITPIALSHPNHAIGYKFEEDGKSFVFLTDNELSFQHPGGLTFDDYVEFSKNSDLLFHDAEFKPEEYSRTKSWGHSIYLDALELAIKAKVKNYGLYHHNQDRNDEGVDELVNDSKRILKERNVEMNCFGVKTGTEFNL